MNAAPVHEEPEVTLDAWAIVRHPDGVIFFAGLREVHDDLGIRDRGRLSTPIESFDAATMTGKTYSGRVYHLAPDARNDVAGVVIAALFWGRAAALAADCLSPDELELALSEPSSGLRH
jgi:hypothetical protein